MNGDDTRDWTITDRAAFLGWRLMTGDVWTTQEVAAMMGITYQGANQLLERVSRLLPIYRGDDRRWRRIEEDPSIKQDV